MARRNKGLERELALSRIRHLFELAVAEERIGRSEAEVGRYVRLGRRIATRYQVTLPVDLRHKVCRECDGLLVQGRSARTRVARGRVSVTCLRCGAVKRYPYRPTKMVNA